MQELTHGIYIENAYPGVTLGALILTHGTILIDAPLRAEDARSWKAALLGLGGNFNRLLVNLDSHTDRTLGARAMECTIIAHQKTAQIFRGRPSVFKGQNAESGSEWETQNETVGTRWAVPDITFTQKVSLYWGPPDVVLEYHPGPTPGSIWVEVPSEKIIFVGDAVLPHQPPFLASADIPAWVETLDVLAKHYRDYTILSGRSGIVLLEAVKAQQHHLKNILKGLERLAKRNAPADETENLIPALLADLTFPAKLEDQFTQRYHHGLYQYYAHHYRPSDLVEMD
jgi:glyoxylase-like metal-dependent hydrolase (beta-lactamase superfamily II)